MTLVFAATMLSVLSAADDKATEAQVDVDYGQFDAARLSCVIGNNKQLGEHRAWYNGVFSLRSPDEAGTPFVPLYAGLNLENYFDARPRHADNAVFFEPRANPIAFKRLSATRAELHQAATPYFGIESWTTFEVKDPYYIDMAYRCVPHKGDLAGGFFGVFWASYINEPEDKSYYFLAAGSSLDQPVWVQYCTQAHDRDSTVVSEKEAAPLTFQDGPGSLWTNLSPLQYSEPFFYGRYRNMVLIFIFEPNPGLRFSHSPSGGGETRAKDGHNPAWDFQLVVPRYEAGHEYGLKMRLVYKPWVDRADVLNEVRMYRAGR